MNHERLSRFLSYILRHNPEEFELFLDEEGWVDVISLLNALHTIPRWFDVSLGDIEHVVEMCPKKRYQIRDEKIRALYGHSIDTRILKQQAIPPERLYHGTPYETFNLIITEGLRPMGRQYVHMTPDKKIAMECARRKSNSFALIGIASLRAHETGTIFYLGNNHVWLSDYISPDFFIETLIGSFDRLFGQSKSRE